MEIGCENQVSEAVIHEDAAALSIEASYIEFPACAKA